MTPTLASPTRLLGALLTSVALAAATALPTDAQADGRRGGPAFHGGKASVPVYRVGGGGGHWRGHGGHWRGYGQGHGHAWGGLALGLGIGALVLSRPWGPVVVEQPAYYYADPPLAVQTPPQPVPSTARPADPVVYPSKGQSAQQTEADRQDCNRWATTQPSAMADASVFHRATMACLEGRGYTVR